MRTKTIKIYHLHELKEDVKRQAYNAWLNKGYGQNHWNKENRESLKEFLKHFTISINNRGFVKFTGLLQTEKLQGQRLATYLWNNYKEILFTGKFYGHLTADEGPTEHKRIDNKYLPSVNKYYKPYHSAITLDSSCVLTGYCMDDSILAPIYEFMKKPDENMNFLDLLTECYQAYERAIEIDEEYACSYESFEADCEANDIEFLKNGDLLFL